MWYFRWASLTPPTSSTWLGFSLDEEREQPSLKRKASRKSQGRFLSGFTSLKRRSLLIVSVILAVAGAGRPGNAEGNMRIETVRLLGIGYS